MAVEDLDDAVETYRRLFRAEIERRGTLADHTAVGRFLAKRGPGMHHVAFEVGDVRRAVEDVTRAGGEIIAPAPRAGLGGKAGAFVHPDSLHGGLAGGGESNG